MDTIKARDGLILTRPGEAVLATDCGAPQPPEPCNECLVDAAGDPWPQDDAVVSIAGDCTSAWCLHAAGTYPFHDAWTAYHSGLGYDVCYWQWERFDWDEMCYYHVLAMHAPVEGRWCANVSSTERGSMYPGAAQGSCPYPQNSMELVGLTCDPETHKVSGGFSISSSPYACFGGTCTATVTIG